MNVWALVVSAVAAFVFSSVWYSVFAKEMARLHPAYTGGGEVPAARPPAWKIPLELVRSLVLAYVIDRKSVV